jgi:hypothetical protein
LESISHIYVWCIGKHVLLWVPPKPHLVYQVGKSLHTSHRMFHCVGQLVAAGEGVPYLDDKGIRFTAAPLPSDFQRRSAQPVPIHFASRRLQGCSTLSIECPVEERICSGESGSISILTEC